ncbi:MAG: NfeD family protein [Lachnospiraceae bacterium]|nr:NfeD family protein [Lachnospiraceae bacterium]
MNVTIMWLIFFVVLVAIEIGTLGLTTIWFAAGALVATIAAAFDAPLFIQITLFIFVSVVLLIFTRPIAVKYFNKDRIKTNAESLIGRQAIVISEIDNLQGIGQVTIGGQEWSARAKEDSGKIALGAVVTVQEIKGVKLIVEEK